MTACSTVIDNRGDALCSDGDACTADACDPPVGCVASITNLDAPLYDPHSCP
jgi:hypothetical protein